MKNKEFVKKEIETSKESHTEPNPASTSKSPTPESKMGPIKDVTPTEKKRNVIVKASPRKKHLNRRATHIHLLLIAAFIVVLVRLLTGQKVIKE